MKYFYSKTLQLPFLEAIEHVKKGLAEKGFGVLTTIDVKQTFKNKLDKDFAPYVILGACNPNFAYQVLQEDPNIGSLLPCSIAVYEQPDGSVTVSGVNPKSMLGIVNDDRVAEAGEQVNAAIAGVIENL